MNRGFAYFLARLASTPNSNMFIVRLGVQLFLNRFGIVGPVATLLGAILRPLIGLIIEDGTFLIDVALDAYREGQKLDEFKSEAARAYEKATAKVYTEAEKDVIRRQYIDIVSRIGAVGLPNGGSGN